MIIYALLLPSTRWREIHEKAPSISSWIRLFGLNVMLLDCMPIRKRVRSRPWWRKIASWWRHGFHTFRFCWLVCRRCLLPNIEFCTEVSENLYLSWREVTTRATKYRWAVPCCDAPLTVWLVCQWAAFSSTATSASVLQNRVSLCLFNVALCFSITAQQLNTSYYTNFANACVPYRRSGVSRRDWSAHLVFSRAHSPVQSRHPGNPLLLIG